MAVTHECTGDSRCWNVGPLSLTSVRLTVTVVEAELPPPRPSRSSAWTTTRYCSLASRSMSGNDVTMMPAGQWGKQRQQCARLLTNVTSRSGRKKKRKSCHIFGLNVRTLASESAGSCSLHGRLSCCLCLREVKIHAVSWVTNIRLRRKVDASQKCRAALIDQHWKLS